MPTYTDPITPLETKVALLTKGHYSMSEPDPIGAIEALVLMEWEWEYWDREGMNIFMRRLGEKMLGPDWTEELVRILRYMGTDSIHLHINPMFDGDDPFESMIGMYWALISNADVKYAEIPEWVGGERLDQVKVKVDQQGCAADLLPNVTMSAVSHPQKELHLTP